MGCDPDTVEVILCLLFPPVPHTPPSQDCDVFVLDHLETVTMEKCKNCRVFLGPMRSRSSTPFLFFLTHSFECLCLCEKACACVSSFL